MITNEDIKDITKSAKNGQVKVGDIAFCILCNFFGDKSVAYKAAYKEEYDGDVDDYYNSNRIQDLFKTLKPFGVGTVDTAMITRDENKAEMLKLLRDIDLAAANQEIDMKDALNMKKDIRVKLQDKFDMEENESQKRIIIVPQKHDMVCPHTNRECSAMPNKEACKKYYNLIER